MKPWLIVGGLFAAGLILAYVLGKTIVIALIGGAAGGLAGALIAWFLKGKDAVQPAPEPQAPVDPTVPLMQGLVILNVNIREQAIPSQALEAVERIIDKLRDLLPQMNSDYKGNDLTWEVNRSAEDYLFRIVKPYMALNPADRQDKLDEFLQGLGAMETALDEVLDVVRNHKQGEFSVKAKFLNARFAR
ncbi:hypothetical protein [Desulfatibacillum aliphaticivorans]|uniref:hypothetical protein n=1 Tax=Desulfatibacillum aliphaticivorans TaxID=218208 RepID=UPI00040C5F51|nr:hypothetical protein [Desulfatibacillum aliphaticivorans]